MRTYTVRFYNDITKEVYAILEFDRDRFTKREYDTILMDLFAEACRGVSYRALFADVYECKMSELPPLDKLGVLTIACSTLIDGSSINSNIFINSRHVRKMTIAE